MRLLLVEDDPDLSAIVARALRREHFHVDCESDGLVAVARARKADYQLVLLDLSLPGCSGLQACQRLRLAKVDVPILVISGTDGLEERVEVLDAGADDCLVKPFALTELLARVRAVTRRGRTRMLRATVDYGPLSLDPRDHCITLHGTQLDLTATEYRLLAHLMTRAEAIVSREELVHHVWGGSVDRRSNTVEVYISYVRHRLSEAGLNLIHTVRGMGYVLRAADS